MRETELVEWAFYSGWLEALGLPLMSASELEALAEHMRSPVAEMISDYVLKAQEETDA